MLSKLYISNYALIETLEIDLKDGLTIITGETGAGKSIILGALSLILGERAESKSISDSGKKTVVEATFGIKGYDLKPFFAENDIDYDESECIIRREISGTGRSRAFINDTPVNTGVLKEISSRLIDIHSQHSNTLLGRSAYQLTVLDSLSKNVKLRNDYSETFGEYKRLKQSLAKRKAAYAKTKEEEDYIQFQLKQIQDLALKENEDEELEQKRQLLENASDIKEALWWSENALDGENGSVIDTLRQVEQRLSGLEQSVKELRGVGERVRSAIIDLKDISDSASYIERDLTVDPAALIEVEDRLNAIYSLEKKHNVNSVNHLLAIQEDYLQKLQSIDDTGYSLNDDELKVKELEGKAQTLADALTKERKKSATDFERQLKEHCKLLGLPNMAVEVEMQQTELQERGQDMVRFLVSFNKNQRLHAVHEVASGGELSRMMLCIKAIIAGYMNLPTIIFDEVDTGVSGDIAARVGDMMKDISRHIQVIAITHLPQVAAVGDEHLRVYKIDKNDKTQTGIETLDSEQHVMEVAKMLSGKEINDAAIENARVLIEHKGK